jgi:hypothetical protein
VLAGGIARREMAARLNIWLVIGARMPKSLKGIDKSELGRVLALIMLLVAVPEVE